jgi:hypothetical protein
VLPGQNPFLFTYRERNDRLAIKCLPETRKVSMPILAVSGAERSQSLLNLAGYYTADFTVQKPFKTKQLLDAVKNTLGA